MQPLPLALVVPRVSSVPGICRIHGGSPCQAAVLEMFRAVSCGGSCAPANLWWEQSGVMYQIQIKLRNGLTEKDQEKILVETANSTVPARRQ